MTCLMGPDPSAPDRPRETSGATNRLVVAYVRERAGDAGVDDLLRRSGLDRTLAELEDEAVWTSYEERLRLFAAAAAVLGDPDDTMFQIGASSLRNSMTPSIVLLLRALGSPRQVFRQLPRAVAKFSTTSTMEVLEASRTHAIIRYRLHDGYEHSRMDCRYAQGLFSVVPELFGLPPARILHEECESDGHEACVYHVTWARRSRWRPSRAAAPSADSPELIALRQQLEALQSAASDLVGSEDVDTALTRVIERAAAAVLAQGYLLSVAGPDGTPLVRYAGIDAIRAEELAAALDRGEDLGPSTVVVDVASTRRHHGRLAALYSDGQRGLADEARLLGAYAGHAAAALDLLTALEESRRDHRAAASLLALARDLARASTPQEVADVAVAAAPRILGKQRATVWFWDDAEQALTPVASAGFSAEEHDALLGRIVRPGDAPELAAMLADLQPQLLRPSEAHPALARLLADFGTGDSAVAPLVADGRLQGVVTAVCPAERPPGAAAALLETLGGVADQTAIALQNARLVARIRHQSLHDPLTGLPNRVRFAELLEAALGAPDGPGATAVLFCDIDDFKRVNDTLGHAAGDELLRGIAERLRGAVRTGDAVGRLSGDEFALLLPAVASMEAARTVAEAVIACFDHPFHVEGADLRVTTSVGIALDDGRGAVPDTLLRRADAAMYEAKLAGRNRLAVG